VALSDESGGGAPDVGPGLGCIQDDELRNAAHELEETSALVFEGCGIELGLPFVHRVAVRIEEQSEIGGPAGMRKKPAAETERAGGRRLGERVVRVAVEEHKPALAD
jgi:hypothetical protein